MVRARLGYAIDRLLIYSTGGLAIADIGRTCNVTPLSTFASEIIPNVRIGWNLGGGVEYAFASRWSAWLEYLYSDFGCWNETQQAVRAGYTYHFRLLG